MESDSIATEFNSLQEAEEHFEFFWKEDSCFSQWYKSEFEVDGQKYNCAEQYMMHQKAVCFKDDTSADQILKSKSPHEIKKLGRRVQNYDDKVWEEVCYDIVKTGNRHKFSQNPQLKEILFATRGKVLVEASPLDSKWGIGLAKDSPGAWNKSTWAGRNLLGYALTEVRDELMQEAGRV